MFLVRVALVSGALCLHLCTLPNIPKCALPELCALPNLRGTLCLIIYCTVPKYALPLGALCLTTHNPLWNGLVFRVYIVLVV